MGEPVLNKGETCGDRENSTEAGMADLAKALLDVIPKDRQSLWPYRVMAYIANETVRRAELTDEGRGISTKDIHTDVGGNENQEPSAWLSAHWKQISNRHYPEIETALIHRCRAAGLSAYPVLAKTGGKPVFYSIEARELPPLDTEDDDTGMSAEALPSAVRYQPDLKLQLSRRGRLLFSDGLVWSPRRRKGVLAWHLFVMAAAGLFSILVLVGLGSSSKPLIVWDLISIAVAVAIPWSAYIYLRQTWRLFEDRIVIAPDWLLEWTETGATIEVARVAHPERPSTIHVRRYTATCTVCGALVKLDTGEPDFPRRLVGRCQESPREHVFSFDRVTLAGEALRRPPVTIRTS